MSWRLKLLIALSFIPVFCFCALAALRVMGLIRPFTVPAASMAPAVSKGDQTMMEGLTFLARQPRRGDIVVFKTDGIARLQPGTFYVKRIAGEPGDQVRITDGKLFINDSQVSLTNEVGEITYDAPRILPVFAIGTNFTVPSGCYFVLGDNSANSHDSRYWGSVPREQIMGRVAFCYWPPQRMGGVK